MDVELRAFGDQKAKKNRACGAAKSREETPKEGIYSHK